MERTIATNHREKESRTGHSGRSSNETNDSNKHKTIMTDQVPYSYAVEWKQFERMSRQPISNLDKTQSLPNSSHDSGDSSKPSLVELRNTVDRQQISPVHPFCVWRAEPLLSATGLPVSTNETEMEEVRRIGYSSLCLVCEME